MLIPTLIIITLLVLIWLVWQVSTAPCGYEDELGFHYQKPEQWHKRGTPEQHNREDYHRWADPGALVSARDYSYHITREADAHGDAFIGNH